ncbi:myb-like protein D [Mytilus trossulus]|uniref:myb-like protein D n=1 Tax=Mytilus trossulus TaxID=6551 RepID=UPI003006584D
MSKYTNSSVRQSQLPYRLNSKKQVHLTNTLTFTNESSTRSIKYNGGLATIHEIEEDLTNGRSLGDINFNKINQQNSFYAEGNERFNKYKRVKSGSLLQRKKVTSQNKCASDEKHSFSQSTEIIRHNINNNINKRNQNIDRDDNKSQFKDRDFKLKESEPHSVKKFEYTASRISDQRDILCEISDNPETEKSTTDKNLKPDCQINSVKTLKSETNKYRKLSKDKAEDSFQEVGSTATIRSSKIKKYASAIPKLKGNVANPGGLRKVSNFKSNQSTFNNTDLSSNKHCTATTSQPENKVNKLQVQETPTTNVISNKQCLPVPKHTGKKNVSRLYIVDTISRTDKTIPFNKGDVQNQRSDGINKYCRNTRVNEPVTIKGRLSKTGTSRTTLVTKENSDLTESCTGNLSLNSNDGKQNDLKSAGNLQKLKTELDFLYEDFNADKNNRNAIEDLTTKSESYSKEVLPPRSKIA